MLGGVVAIVGGLLALVAIFLTDWVTVGLGDGAETVTAWSLVAGEGELKSNDPYLLGGLALVALVVGALLLTGAARTLVRVAALATGGAIVATAGVHWMSVADFVSDQPSSAYRANTAIGFYLVIAAGIAVAAAALLPTKR